MRGWRFTAKGIDVDIHRQKMGMVFQQFNVFPDLTVLDNITLAPTLLKKSSKEEAVEKAQLLLKRVGLADKAGEFPRAAIRRTETASGYRSGSCHGTGCDAF